MEFSVELPLRDYSLKDNYKKDLDAIRLAVGYYFPESVLTLSNKSVSLSREKLLWFKYFLNKPLIIPNENPKFKIGYFGVKETNDMLILLNSDKFKSISYGLDEDSNGIRLHRSRPKISSDQLSYAYSEVESVLVTKQGLSSQLVEAIAYRKPVVFTKEAKQDVRLTARLPEDIQSIITNTVAQDYLKESTIEKVKELRLRSEDVLRLLR